MHTFFSWGSVMKLVTDRLEFREWENVGIEYAWILWKNTEVTKFLSGNGKFSDEVIENRYKLEVDNYKKYKIQYFPIFYKENRMFVGCCGIKKYVGELGVRFLGRELGDLKNLYEMGFHILPEFWGKGIGEEAALKIIEYAFDELNADAIFAGHNPNNIKSKKLLTKLGFKIIGEEHYEPTGLLHPLYIKLK